MSFPTEPIIRLSKCVLRPWHASDKAEMVRLAGNPKVVLYMTDGFPHPYTEEDADSWLRIAKAEGLSAMKATENKDESKATQSSEEKKESAVSSAPAKPLPPPAPITHLHLAVCLHDGTLVGGTGLVPPGPDGVNRLTREIGYWIGEPYWGRGLATEVASGVARWALGDATASEAAARLHLPAGERIERVYASVFSPNVASSKALTKAGYTKEGVLRRAVIKHKQVLDLVVYGMVSDDLKGE